jgi:dCMP deaminase
MASDKFFISMCWLLATQSKDEKTKLGAVIVGPDGDIKSTGWNSFPRGINDDIEERQERPEKYYWFVHAEHNAILNAGRNGISLKDSILYCSAFPCHNCALAVIQSGITKVVYDKILGGWNDSNNRAATMFVEADIKTSRIQTKPIIPIKFIDGKIVG